MVFTELWIGPGCIPGNHFGTSVWRKIILARDISQEDDILLKMTGKSPKCEKMQLARVIARRK